LSVIALIGEDSKKSYSDFEKKVPTPRRGPPRKLEETGGPKHRASTSRIKGQNLRHRNR